MREITQNIREQTVKQFLQGITYDDISWKLKIAKGSVVNIINEFREGDLSLSGDMTDYVDELRHLVVDLKKHEVTVGQMRSFLRFHNRLKDLEVDDEGIEETIDGLQEMIDCLYPNS